MANSTSRFLPTPKKKEREYTEKQQCFLDSLFKTGGDPKKAAEMAGYADNSHLQVSIKVQNKYFLYYSTTSLILRGLIFNLYQI